MTCANDPSHRGEVDIDSARILKSKKRKAYQQDGSQEQPIIIDDSDSPERESARRQVKFPRKSQQTEGQMQTLAPVAQPMLHASIQQFGAYNDMLTATLVDGICYQGSIRKFYSTHASTHGDDKRVISIIRDLIAEKIDLLGAERQLLELPTLSRVSWDLLPAELSASRQHMRRYLNIYKPDCAFEISSTNRYTMDTQEARIIARKSIYRGREIKYLSGRRIILTADEVTNLDRTGQNFSIVKTTRNNATSFLFGPVQYTNHDCEANARLVTTGNSGVIVIATQDIQIGEEITVTYAEDYFGEANNGCLCQRCEDLCRNGWNPENQKHSNRSCIRVPGDYLLCDSHAAIVAWTHSDQCIETALGAADYRHNPCRVCARHRRLYGYLWPKMKKSSRHDKEERVYPDH